MLLIRVFEYVVSSFEFIFILNLDVVLFCLMLFLFGLMIFECLVVM